MGIEKGINYWSITDVGKVRDHNEDSMLVDAELGIYIVADGMGGHAAGEVASKMAVEEFRRAFIQRKDIFEQYKKNPTSAHRQQVLVALDGCVQDSCEAVHDEGSKDPEKRGMGTTFCALVVIGTRGFIAHVGDSRCYVLRNDGLHQLTQDHSLSNELRKYTKFTEEQIAKMENRNALTRAVGVYGFVEVDLLDFDVLAGDCFLICSDGLYNHVSDEDLEKRLLEGIDDSTAKDLVALANNGGGRDNITVVAVSIPMTTETSVLAQEVTLKLSTLQKMPLFQYLSYQELVTLLNITEVREYAKEATVVEQGDKSDELFIVLEGEVSVRKGQTIIAELGRGQHFGEMALLQRTPRSATVVSKEESRLLVIGREEFLECIRTNNDMGVKLLWSFISVLSERLRGTSGELSAAKVQLHSYSTHDTIIDRST